LDQLLTLALPLLRQSQCRCPRTGPGRKPDYDDWKLAAMILCGVLKKKKSKSAQYAFIQHNAAMLLRVLDLARLPARSTFFERYGRVWPLVQEAIALQGRTALREHVADAATVAADKSLIAAVGPVWHKRHRQRGIVPKGLRGLDREAAWGYSDYHDWIYGYSFEVVVTAPPNRSGTAAFPLLASVDIASASEQRSFALKVPQLPRSTRFVDVDSGYDTDDLADLVELPPPVPTASHPSRHPRRRRCRRRRWRRRYLCPPRNGSVGACQRRGQREQRRQRRLKRQAFLQTRRGRVLYARRKQTVEPFNGTFKRTFELDEHVWHRGLHNNRTQILVAIFCYQLLVRYHHKCCGHRDAQIQSLLDCL
jgi:hypothetical protein